MAYKNPADAKAYARKHYEANKPVYLARAKAHNLKTRAKVKNLIADAKYRPCADCGLSYPSYVMQFDHLGDKQFTVGDSNRDNITIKRVVAEIAKCEVVCANCHAERTHRRRQAVSV